jgi:hypothetical protein
MNHKTERPIRRIRRKETDYEKIQTIMVPTGGFLVLLQQGRRMRRESKMKQATLTQKIA